MPVRRGGAKSLLERNPFHALQPGFEEFVCFRLNPIRDDGVRRAAVWRVVFEAAIMWRIVRRRDDDAVGESGLAPAVVGENRVGNRRRRGIFVPFRDHDFHSVGRQHLQRAGQRRDRERMRVHAQETAGHQSGAAFGTGKSPD